MRSSDGQFPCFAIGSRIKAEAASQSYLAGLRILIKDNMHLKGVKTSLGKKAYYETYPPRQETARCVEELINGGAVVVGKTKMSPFGSWEAPMEYYNDYQAPWNPRADRFQSPGGGSSGSAAAVASYEWLDVALGTDSE